MEPAFLEESYADDALKYRGWFYHVDASDGGTGGDSGTPGTGANGGAGGTGGAGGLIVNRGFVDGTLAAVEHGAVANMIAGGEEGSTPRSDMVTLVPGLGLTHAMIVDQHFRQRDRLGRLLTSISYNPRPIGIGLDEDTAAFIDPQYRLEVVGSGALTIVDPSELEFSSMDSAKRHDPVCLINIRLHVLVEGGTYDIETRVARPAATAPEPAE